MTYPQLKVYSSKDQGWNSDLGRWEPPKFTRFLERKNGNSEYDVAQLDHDAKEKHEKVCGGDVRRPQYKSCASPDPVVEGVTEPSVA